MSEDMLVESLLDLWLRSAAQIQRCNGPSPQVGYTKPRIYRQTRTYTHQIYPDIMTIVSIYKHDTASSRYF